APGGGADPPRCDRVGRGTGREHGHLDDRAPAGATQDERRCSMKTLLVILAGMATLAVSPVEAKLVVFQAALAGGNVVPPFTTAIGGISAFLLDLDVDGPNVRGAKATF